MESGCDHLAAPTVAPNGISNILNRVIHCNDCNLKGLDLWICLYKDCNYIGCSENSHGASHYKKNPSHCVQISATNGAVWCFECGDVENVQRSHSECRTSSNTISLVGGLKGTGDKLLGFERGPSLNVSGAGDSQESSDADEEDMLDNGTEGKPRGLVGLQNIGNTCYMNSAIQALSNTPPLTQYFLDCGASVDFLTDNKKPGLSRSYQLLVREIWHKKTRGYVVPKAILYGIRNVHPMFRGYHQHDTQEFLRCFMDQLHEELKEPIREEKPVKSNHSKYGYITRQPLQKNSKIFPQQSEARAQVLKSKDIEREKGLFRNQKSSARSFDNIPSATAGHYYRMNLNSDEHGNGHDVFPGHRRSVSYCDPRGYFQLPQEFKDDSPSSSPRPGSPLEFMDHESSEKEPDEDEEETYETCDSGVSDAASDFGEDTCAMSSSKGFKRKNESDNIERSQSDNEKDSGSASVRFRSVISDVFDGRLLSSVQCLTCDRISTRVETFQDLSLPIPSRDHMAVLHNGGSSTSSSSVQSNGSTSGSSGRGAACSDAVYSAASSQEGWVWWLLSWLRSWLYGPAVTLHDCLAAFFSADELKGDNMYSCEKCNKLRNGVKFSKVLGLPEVLCVHLKRFRHELMSSTKIGAKVSFPLSGLDMRPYIHKDCSSTVSTYDLVAVICHAGTAGGGHYTCVARNRQTGRWFEFDDQLVTGLTPEQVSSCEAYVLFYKKSNPRMTALRQRAVELSEACNELNDIKFYVSKQWINRFNTYAEPGPIDNRDFLCPHGGVSPDRVGIVERLTVVVSQSLWEFLYENFGGGPVCNHLHCCMVCRMEVEKLQQRQKSEFQQFTFLQQQFSSSLDQDLPTSAIYAISMNWFRTWQAFVRNKTQQPPPPIDNTGIIKPSQDENKAGPSSIQPGSDYAQLNEDLWRFFFEIYGGGPEVKLKSAPFVQTHDQPYTSNVNSTGNLSNKSYAQSSAYGSYSGHPSHVSSTVLTSQPKQASNYDIHKKESDSDETYHPEVHTKSLSNVDLFNVANKYEGNTKMQSVKGTQSLQDVSVQNYTTMNSHHVKRELKSVNNSIENHDSLDYSVGKNSLDHCNGDVSVKYSREMSSDDSEYQNTKTKSKKVNAGKKSRRLAEQTKSSLSTESSVPDAFHQNSQREENTSISNNKDENFHNPQFATCENPSKHHLSSDENHKSADTSFDLPNLENISLKPKVEVNNSANPQNSANKSGGGKHKKPSRKLKRQQAAVGHKKNNNSAAPQGEFVPVVNGGEKMAK